MTWSCSCRQHLILEHQSRYRERKRKPVRNFDCQSRTTDALPYPDELLLPLLLPDPLEELPELPDEEPDELPEVGDLLGGAMRGAPQSTFAMLMCAMSPREHGSSSWG